MVESREVDFGDETIEVVYDDENDLVYKRTSDEELKNQIGGRRRMDDDGDIEFTHDSEVWGMTTADSEDALRELAERYEMPVGECYVTPKYLRQMAERLEDDIGSAAARLIVTRDLPVLLTPADREQFYVLAPRVGVDGDHTYDW
jgi:hypothetical protein